jgi:hypothetical protein
MNKFEMENVNIYHCTYHLVDILVDYSSLLLFDPRIKLHFLSSFQHMLYFDLLICKRKDNCRTHRNKIEIQCFLDLLNNNHLIQKYFQNNLFFRNNGNLFACISSNWKKILRNYFLRFLYIILNLHHSRYLEYY